LKAARIHRFGAPDEIAIEELPRPAPAVNQVLVRVASAGVGPWDALIREGKSVVSPLPLTLGSDLSGVVEALGPGVAQYKPGDETMASPTRSSSAPMPDSRSRLQAWSRESTNP
jgi:NADPH:quinone reductase-like Zn-dependent oxidoreductase